MKINEIIIREVQPVKVEPDDQAKKLDTTQGPSDNQRFKGRTGAPEPSFSQADRDAMFFAYRGDPEFRNYVQYAISMPHIKTMPQAIAYATAELAARRARDADLPDVRGDLAKKGLEPWGTGPDAQTKAGQGFKRIQRDIQFDRASGGTIPGLDQVKNAISDLADWAGEKIGLDKKVSTSTQDVVTRGAKFAKDLRS
jgi:hypothetical protein